MSKFLDTDLMAIPCLGGVQRVVVDGVEAELTVFPGKVIRINGTVVMIAGGTTPYVYRWPVVRDERGVPLCYNVTLDILTVTASQVPVGVLKQVRMVGPTG